MTIVRAPLRVSFFGGGTDLPEYFLHHGGSVLSTAIDKYSYVTVSSLYANTTGYKIKLSYRENEEVDTVDSIRHPVLKACLRHVGISCDVEIHTIADLPSLTGLGSSSSFTVALLDALYKYKGMRKPRIEIAYEAIYIEREVLKEAVGCQDQFIAAVGGFNVIEFRKTDEIHVHPLRVSNERIRELRSYMCLIFTGIKRRAVEIESKKISCLQNNLETLASMRRMVDEGARILEGTAPIEQFGKMLDEAWKSKRSLEKSVTNGEIDAMYETAVEMGAWGGKVLGAGGGGFLLLMGPDSAIKRISQCVGHGSIPFEMNAPGVIAIM